MAASKPAVATAVGGVPEVMADGETGYLVPSHDVKALADRITALLRTTRCARAWARLRWRGPGAFSRSSGWWNRRPPPTHAWPAEVRAEALGIALRTTEAARAHHPDVAQREVVADRVGRVDRAQ